MGKYVLAEIRFEICEDEMPTNAELDSLYCWLEGTLDNAPMDEEVGFPDSIESCAMVRGVSVKEDRPKA